MSKLTLFFSFLIIFILGNTTTKAQFEELDTNPINGFAPKQKFTVGSVRVQGGQYLDTTVLKTIFGIVPGEKVELPQDEKIARGLKAVWNQGLLEDLAINVSRIYSDTVDLVMVIKERPSFSFYSIVGVTKTEKAELKEKIDRAFQGARIVSEALKVELKERTYRYFVEKGYSNAVINVIEEKARGDAKTNQVSILIDVKKGPKIKINQINIVGNENVSDIRLKKKMKGTKEKARFSLYPAYSYSLYGNEPLSFNQYLNEQGYYYPTKTLEYLDPYFRYNIFGSSKFDNKKFTDDKKSMVQYYNAVGYRDATIVKDTVYDAGNNALNIDIAVEEGKKYYFGDISWSGNTRYSDSVLDMVIGINRGDVFNRELLDSKLGAVPSMDGSLDLGSLYLDQGYLFFRATAHETAIKGDTIDFRIDIMEGLEARIKRIEIVGNNKTNDHVIRRELYTKPGNVFSRSDVFRSIRQLSQLGYIDPATINPVPKPNPADNTVDIIYNVEEKPNDQIELQAGYGGGIGFTGTAGITLNNFSLRSVLKKNEWKPLPMGDGQNLSLRWQSNGLYFNSLNMSFTEPWLGGKKPIGLTFGIVYTRYSTGTYNNITNPNDSYISNYGANLVISKRLKWPDNSFVGAIGVNFQSYFLKNYTQLAFGEDFSNGTANNLNFILNIGRNTLDNPIYPRSGSNLSLNVKITPPYSLFAKDKDYENMPNSEKFKWIEYHKYRFDADWYQQIKGDLVLRVSGKFGYLGYFNKDIGHSPFERFQLGGDGMTGFNFFVGRDVISQRGYEIYRQDATIFNKYTVEVRYPFSLNPNSTIFGLAFFESGNAWNSFAEYNPFRLNRSAGLGLRMRLPMFGLLGFDYGFGFDAHQPGNKFSQSAKFTFMLGREPD